MAQDSEIALYGLFFNKEELLPLWLRLRPHIEAFGGDVRIKLRERYAEFAPDRKSPHARTFRARRERIPRERRR